MTSQLQPYLNRPGRDALAAFAAPYRIHIPRELDACPREVALRIADHCIRALTPLALQALAGDHPALQPLLEEAEKLRALPAPTPSSVGAFATAARSAQREAALIRWDAEDYAQWRKEATVPDSLGVALLEKARETRLRSNAAYHVLRAARECIRSANLAACCVSGYEGHYAHQAARAHHRALNIARTYQPPDELEKTAAQVVHTFLEVP